MPPEAATCSADSVSAAAPRAPAHSSATVGRAGRRRGEGEDAVGAEVVDRGGVEAPPGERDGAGVADPEHPGGLGVGGRVEERQGAVVVAPGQVPAAGQEAAERRAAPPARRRRRRAARRSGASRSGSRAGRPRRRPCRDRRRGRGRPRPGRAARRAREDARSASPGRRPTPPRCRPRPAPSPARPSPRRQRRPISSGRAAGDEQRPAEHAVAERARWRSAAARRGRGRTRWWS